MRAHDLKADLAREIGWPVIIVVKNRLGALNHAALTVRQVQSTGLTCAGLVINDGPAASVPEEDAETIAKTTNRAVLEAWLGVPVMFDVRPGQETL